MIANIKQRLVLLLSLVCLLAVGTLSVQARQSLLTNYTPNGASFKYETAINFQKQSFKIGASAETISMPGKNYFVGFFYAHET